MWTPEEWQDVALRLLKVNPTYLHDPRPIFHAAEVREAMAGLPPERRRPVATAGMANMRPGFMRAYAGIRATLGDTQLKIAAPQDAPAPVAAAAPPAEPSPAAGNWRHNKRVKWTPAEFLIIAKYLRQRYPNASYIHSTTAAGLTIAEIREAMYAALPAARQRPLKTMNAPLRAYFVAAFKAAKMEQFRQAEREEREQKIANKAAKELAAPPPEAPRAHTIDTLGHLVKPIIDLLAGELLAQLGPRIEALIASALAVPQSPQHGSGALTLVPATPYTPPKPRKKIIGVIGPLPVQEQELIKSFPQFEIIAMTCDNINAGVSAMRSAARVIGMTSFMNHSSDGVLAKTFKDKYVRVTGGVTAIKRQIEVWIASGALNEAAVA
jgi:DNA-binding transcriptional MerR regulator